MKGLNLIASGYNIHGSIYVSDHETVKRSFFERLFSLTPFKKTKSVYSPKVYIIDKTIVCSKKTESILIKAIGDL